MVNHILPIDSKSVDYIYQLATPNSISEDEVELLFAARMSGLFYSRDGGRIWESAYKHLQTREALPTIAIALSPDFTQEPHIFSGLNGAILHSYDAGKNWYSSTLPTPPPVVSSLIISPDYSQDGIIFAGTNEDGVLVSKNRGLSWISWNFGLLDLNILCLAISPDFASDETLYAGAESGLFKSTNGGRAWREVTLPFGFDAILSLAISPKFSQDGTIYVGTENNGLLVSQDRGKSWRSFESIRDHPVNMIFLSPDFPDGQELLLLHGGTLKITKDNGKTWKTWRRKLLGRRHVVTALVPNGFDQGTFIGLEDGSVFRI
jgi:photosystem II stability/assembly factor-like uncharacterized protein